MRRRALRVSPGAVRTAARQGRAQWAEVKAADSPIAVRHGKCSMRPAHRAAKRPKFHSSPLAIVRCTAVTASSPSLAPYRVAPVVVVGPAATAVVLAGARVRGGVPRWG